ARPDPRPLRSRLRRRARRPLPSRLSWIETVCAQGIRRPGSAAHRPRRRDPQDRRVQLAVPHRLRLLCRRGGPSESRSRTNDPGVRLPRWGARSVLKTKADLRVLVRPVVTFAVPKRDGDIRGTPADISRAKTLMGWEPAVDWRPTCHEP